MHRLAVRFASLFALFPALALASPALDADEIELLRLINAYRAQNGLGCLTPSPTMNAAADYMSRAMGELGFFSHQEPPCTPAGECMGRDPFDRIIAFGHDQWTTAGENIACGQRTPFEAFDAWRNSPGHNANMLHPGFTAIGIGRVTVEKNRCFIFWTNNFSNWIDGEYDCEGNWNGEGPEPGTWGWGGDGGSGGEGGGGEGGSGGQVAAPKMKSPADSGSNCSTTSGPSAWLSALALLLLVRRR